jgi:TrmH family RNA methyltransferase
MPRVYDPSAGCVGHAAFHIEWDPVERRRIDSPKNPLVKELVRLRERRERDRSGRFLIEGQREVERALSAGVPLTDLLIAPELAAPVGLALAARAERSSIPVTELAAAAFERASMREHPDGVLAVAPTWRSELAELELGPDPLLLVLDGLEKPGNLGALLRTADAVDADAVIVTGRGTDPFNPNVIRASMGSVFSRPLVTATDRALREFLRAAGIRIVATAPAADRPYWDAGLRGPVALVLGTEHEGLGEEWLAAADDRVTIPMAGMADSLNVATAGALVLYEALRQRREG